MDWLKDKKNQPIVITILAVVIVGAAVAFYFMSAGGSDATTSGTETAAQPSGMDPAAAPEMDFSNPSGDPSASAAQPAAAPKAPAVGSAPMEAYRADPFQVPGYKPPKDVKRKPKPRIPDLPMFNISRVEPREDVNIESDKAQPARRMAGLVLNNKIFAIIETNGRWETVQPGDMLKDRLAVVDTIEKDRIILKTTDRVPKYLVVRMASAPRTASSQTAAESVRPGRGGRIPGPGRSPGGAMDMPAPMPSPM